MGAGAGTPKDEEIVAEAKSRGAITAVIVPSGGIVVAHWVRLKCMYGCPDYGRWRTCPPYTPDAETMGKVLSEYEKVLLMTTKDHSSATKLAVDMMFWMYSKGVYKSFPLGSGRCRLCEVCTPEDCKHPELAYPSMEACSIDVFSTAIKNGIDLNPEPGTHLHLCALLLY